MGSWERKTQRQNIVKKKKLAEQELAKKTELMGSLSDRCLTCEKLFDKKDKEQVQSWSVVVREKENKVNLYCPECWNKAQKIIKEFAEFKQSDN